MDSPCDTTSTRNTPPATTLVSTTASRTDETHPCFFSSRKCSPEKQPPGKVRAPLARMTSPHEIITIPPNSNQDALLDQCFSLRVAVFHHEQRFPLDTEFDGSVHHHRFNDDLHKPPPVKTPYPPTSSSVSSPPTPPSALSDSPPPLPPLPRNTNSAVYASSNRTETTTSAQPSSTLAIHTSNPSRPVRSRLPSSHTPRSL